MSIWTRPGKGCEFMLERCLSLLIGYFCGSILTADLLTRQKGKADIRQLGSGNPGAANVALQLGPGWGLLVLLGDVGKTMLACLMCRFLLFPELGGLAVLYAGLGAVLGHNWPLWTRFQGGKGVAALCTLSVLYLPAAGAVTIGLMLLVCAVSHRLSIGAAAIGPAFLLAMVCLRRPAEDCLLAGAIAPAMLVRSLIALLKEKKMHSGR